MRISFVCTFAFMVFLGCGGGDSNVCEPGRQLDCTCTDGRTGAQTCLSDGSGWGECECACEPDCAGNECGPDGCGDICGECDNLEVCNEAEGTCDCAFSACGDECCGELELCYEGACCAPDCSGRECGDDGCGGTCSPGCDQGEICSEEGLCFDPTCGSTQCTSAEQCVMDAVCVRKPGKTAKACEKNEDVFQEIGPADLGCHNLDPCSADGDCPKDNFGTQLVCRGGFCGVPAPEGPDTVTFRGCVDAFGIGDTTHQVKVALYRGDRDPTGIPDWEADTFEDQSGCAYWGAFELDDVPTNTPLILKTYDQFDDFVVTYKYNLILWADLAQDEGGGSWVFDTRSTVTDPRTGIDISLNPWRGFAIGRTTFDVILLSVGINELPENSGVVMGTVRDCGYHAVEHASCGFLERPGTLTYFNNAENPLPENSIDSTNVNGIYAAIDIPEGSHTMACLAQDEQGNNIPLGTYPVEVFDGGVTIMSLDWYPGLQTS